MSGSIVVSAFVTLDGVMEAPGGEPGHPHSGWVRAYQGEEQIRFKFQEALEAESILAGRITYESLAGAWPNYKGEFADRMNAMPKYVVSSTLKDPGWNNARLLEGDVPSAVRGLKEQSQGEILIIGSRTLVHTLIEHDLIDEFRIMVFPVVLGSGRRLFPESPRKIPLRLVAQKTFGSGVVETRYRPAGDS